MLVYPETGGAGILFLDAGFTRRLGAHDARSAGTSRTRACERVTGKAREIESVIVAPVQWREREPLTERRRREASTPSYWRGTVSAPL